MSLLGDLLLGLLGGVAMMTAGVIGLSVFLPKRWQRWLGRMYFGWTAQINGRSMLVFPENGRRPELKISRFDDSVGAEGVEIDGSEKHFRDPDGNMGLWHGRPFGIAHASSNVVLTPKEMELGKVLADRRATNDLEVVDAGQREWVSGWVRMPDGPRLVNPLSGQDAVDGDADPGIGSRVKTFVELSQDLFNTRQTVQQIMFLVAAATGFGLVGLGAKVAEDMNTGGGGVNVPVGVIMDLGVSLL